MIEQIKNISVTSCHNNCPFFGHDPKLMECTNPYFDGKPLNDRLIINIDNCRGNQVPNLCPLKLDSVKISQIVKLK